MAEKIKKLRLNLQYFSEKRFTQAEAEEIIEQRLQEMEQAQEAEQQAQTEPEGTDYRKLYLDALKKKALTDENIPLEKAGRYVKYIETDDPAEVEKAAKELAEDIEEGERAKQKKSYGDPNGYGTQAKTKFKNPFRKGDE
ncbi:hypothetical protein [Salimicrobium humidisoli]|uniref:Uncharacterized protein n=1 Tax=Salimicrobium humidisoli TaxID=2029857 RepID=A0ABX4HRM0_9BACI|nr:hypothetical protein [Salimicrobium humidisoli]PBB05735.1 hypothetical protein CKW00_06970 [Salimicrobium humidisoli]